MSAASESQPKELVQSPDHFKVGWTDGHESKFPFRALRLACPCAMCKDEWTGKTLLDPASVPADVGVAKSELIGNYALAFQFSDGHSTGIYSFGLLRQLCPCSSCARPK